MLWSTYVSNFTLVDKSAQYTPIGSLRAPTTAQALGELTFWKENIRRLNGQSFMEQKVHDVEVFSDASFTGYGGFVSGSGNWTEAEVRDSGENYRLSQKCYHG